MHSTVWWIVTGILFLGVYSGLEFIYRYRFTSRGKKKIPTQLPLPFIGNALHFLKDRSSIGVLKAMCSYLPVSPISAVWLGPRLMVMISEPNVAKNLLVKGIASKKPEYLYSVFDLISDGVFTTRDIKKWLALRKPLDKMLEPKWAETWIEVFNRHADTLCEAIGSNTEKFHVLHQTFEYTMTNLAETHLGLENVERFAHLWPTVQKDIEQMIDTMMNRLWNITTKPDILFKMTTNHSELVRAHHRCNATYKLVRDARKSQLKEKNLDLNEDRCYLDLIMLLTKRLNYDQEDSKFGTDFIAAGVHTTSFTLASTLLFLAMSTECQRKLYEEIRTVFGESSEAPTEEQLNRMQYMDMVIKETLRHAGVPGVGRHLEKDVELDGYIFPKNSILWFNQMKLNYDPKYWERPKEFYPEHFTPKAEEARPKGAFLPFSLGARNCPGKMFATIAIKVALSKALRQYEFSTHLRFEDVKYNFNVVRIPSVYDVEVKRRTPFK